MKKLFTQLNYDYIIDFRDHDNNHLSWTVGDFKIIERLENNTRNCELISWSFNI